MSFSWKLLKRIYSVLEKSSSNTGVNIQWCAEFVPSAPMDTSLTPLLAMKSSALLTLLILWTLILPLSGLGNLSPAQRHEEFSHAFHRISTNTNPRLNISSALHKWTRGFWVNEGSLQLTDLRWPRGAAWVWVHLWNPPRCFRSAFPTSAGESCTRPWKSRTNRKWCQKQWKQGQGNRKRAAFCRVQECSRCLRRKRAWKPTSDAFRT